ncbi:uncharacterized protein FIBRA_02363 [Fibroporia radiculosa]|uniref:Ketoreductase (KR) domain-containing protein n=1 Tax=Fibroporia radiculosa TaxID=599839 RepID=J4G1M9_9APHY|nr:uncharacterized protein FIBRA_02363 [Fibroporia radiculosa]CCM00333.1 predicted protein [Fibroporia radiculosa]
MPLGAQSARLGQSLVHNARPVIPSLSTGRATLSTAHALRSASKSPLRMENQKNVGHLPSYAPVGVSAALDASPSSTPKPTLFDHEFSLADRVALVSGGNRGLGLEMAMSLVEAGARVVYCVDLPKQPGEEWTKVKEYVGRMQGKAGQGRLEYISADTRDQEAMWRIGEKIGDTEGRMDACVAAAGILKPHTDCLDYPAKQFQEARRIHSTGSAN